VDAALLRRLSRTCLVLGVLAAAGLVAARVASAPPDLPGNLYDRSAERLRSAPEAAAPVILVLGDSGSASPELDANIAAMAREGALVALHAGDVTYTGPLEYGRFLAAVGRLPFPVLAVPGDHDRDEEEDYATYDRLVGGRNRFVDGGGVRFVLLDSGDEHVGEAGFAFLERALRDRSRPRRAVVLTHVPPFVPGTPFPASAGRGHALRDAGEARRLVDLLRETGVSLLACGHIHAYAFDASAGVPLLVSGGGGKDVEPGESFHYARVTLVDPLRVERVVTAPAEGLDPFRHRLDRWLGRWLNGAGATVTGLLLAAGAGLEIARRRRA